MNSPTYTVRHNAWSRRKTYTLTEQGVTVAFSKKTIPPRLISWNDIAAVEMVYAPGPHQPNRFYCRLRLGNGRKEDFLSFTYVKLADIRDQAGSFVPFVRALHEKIAAHNPDCRFGRTSGGWADWGRKIFFVLTLAVLLVSVSFLLFDDTENSHWGVIIRTLLVASFLPLLWVWIKRNRPARYDPRAIPDHLLPKHSDS